jgi:hypothetical protein
MLNLRNYGLKHSYYDKLSKDDFSNFSLGLISRSLGHNLKIAYVNFNNSGKKLSSFFENLSLNYSFLKNFKRMHFEIFDIRNNNRIERTVLPLVEYNTINQDYFIKLLKEFDLIIVDNFSFSNLSENYFNKILFSKSQNTELFFIFNDKKDFEKTQDNFENVNEILIKENNNLFTNKRIKIFEGDETFPQLYSYGYLLRNYIHKKDTKLIFFDMGDFEIFGEFLFFKSLREINLKLNKIYGNFDYVITGYKRFYGGYYRNDVLDLDKIEANEGLQLLKTSVRKQTPVLAGNLGNVIEKKILNLEDLNQVLNLVKDELLITSNNKMKNFELISKEIFELKNLKKPKIFLKHLGFDF